MTLKTKNNWQTKKLGEVCWEVKKLGEVCEIERGSSPRPIKSFLTDSPKGINWIKIGDTKGVTKYIHQTKEKIKPEGARRSRIVNDGDFILSNSMSFGRPYIMKTMGCIHDGWLVLREKEPNIDKDFLYYVLSSDLIYKQFNNLAAGSTVRNLNIDLVKSVKIPLPPLPEQKRIVAILDEAFVAIATAKENAEKNLQNARELFESYLQSVFANPGDGWEEKTLGKVCSDFLQGINTATDKTVFVNSGIPIFQAKEIGIDKLELGNCKFITQDKYEAAAERYKPQIGDILYNNIGSSMGRSIEVVWDYPFTMMIPLG